MIQRLNDRLEREGIPVSGLVLSSPRTGRARDERNVFRAMRDLLDGWGHPWSMSHSFRRTVASLVDEPACPSQRPPTHSAMRTQPRPRASILDVETPQPESLRSSEPVRRGSIRG